MPRASTSEAARQQDRSTLPLLSHSAGNRQAELNAAFGSDEEDDFNEEDNGRRLDVRIPMPAPQSSPPGDVFFDAGDAMQSDPLGAHRTTRSSLGDAPPYSAAAVSPPSAQADNITGGGAAGDNGYDFEGASYFTPTRAHTSRANSANVSRAASPGALEGLDRGNGISPSIIRASDANQTSISRMRIALGRFGRFVGMRVPGATYSSLNTDDESGARLPRTSARGVMGGGLGQDGVFANLNAKPERRRRRGENGEDLGDDDDLVDDVLPPTYETAAADTAPPYWETTIIGGPGGLHPLAPGGMGWTPGGAHVGAIEDLIVEGLPVGNFFGFAWNLLVSMSFQFVGFLLTYLLHTTHAARCGSRAGLGITLVQYGFYLRTRAMQIAEGKLPDDGLSPIPIGSDDAGSPSAHSVWWSTEPQTTGAGDQQGQRDLIQRGISFIIRQTMSASNGTIPMGNTTSLADILAADDGGGSNVVMPSAESMSASTEWLAYILMGIGWFILLSSVLSYWRVHRWGRQLVDAARRESERDENGEGREDGGQQEGQNAPVGFIHSLRRALRGNGRNGRRGSRTHSAEDWIIYPGRRRGEEDLDAPTRVPSGRAASMAENNSDERLLQSMRNVGLLA